MMLFRGPDPRKVLRDYVQPPDHATEPVARSAAKTKEIEHIKGTKSEPNGKCSDVLWCCFETRRLMKRSACLLYLCGKGKWLQLWATNLKVIWSNPIITKMLWLSP